MNIYILEADPLQLKAVSKVLKELGHQTADFNRVDEFLEKVTVTPDDRYLLGYSLKQLLNGVAVAKNLLEKGANPKQIVFLTGLKFYLDKELQRYPELKGVAIFDKADWTKEDLMAALSRD